MANINPDFTPTRWSLVALVTANDGPDAETALNEICRIYWYPLYAYLRRTGLGAPEAEDMTQDFLAWFVEKRHIERADAARGKLRSFLLACLKRFAANHYRRSQAQKRGGHTAHIVIDQDWAEERLLVPATNGSDPDVFFDREWARDIFESAMGRLHEFFESKGQPERFRVLRPFLTGDQCNQTLTEAADTLNISEGAAKGVVHRMRERFKELLTQEVRQTLTHPDSSTIDEELGYLLQVLSAA